jgi:hypothetical protein
MTAVIISLLALLIIQGCAFHVNIDHPLLRTHLFDRQTTPVPELNEQTTSLSLLFIIKPKVIAPISGNITVDIEHYGKLMSNRKPIFAIGNEYPWRKPSVHFTGDTTIECSIDERLHPNNYYSIFVEIFYERPVLYLTLYLNGVMKNRCNGVMNSPPFEHAARSFLERSPGIKLDIADNSSLKTVHVAHVLGWFERLSYSDIQYISTLPYLDLTRQLAAITTSPTQTNLLHTPQQRLEFTWFRKYKERVSASSNSLSSRDVCGEGEAGECALPSSMMPISGKIVLILWPSFYSLVTPAHPLSWYTNDIAEAVTHLLLSLPESPHTYIHIFIPISDIMAQETNHVLMQRFQSSNLSGRSLALSLFPFSAAPYVSSKLSAKYPYAPIVNALVASIQRDLSPIDTELHSSPFVNIILPVSSASASLIPDQIVLLSTHLRPQEGWLNALIADPLNRNGVIGGKIMSPSALLLHYGYELLELPFTGGIDVYLIPHDKYRYVHLCEEGVGDNCISSALSNCKHPSH